MAGSRLRPIEPIAERRCVIAGDRSPAGRLPDSLRAGRFDGVRTMTLSVGQRVTLLRIDEMLAMSHRFEFEVRSVLEPMPIGFQGRNTRVGTVRQRGKRKEQYLDLKPDDILLDGWDQPFRTDTEVGCIMAGNACYNLIGDPNEIRQAIETRAAWPITDDAKAKIIVSRNPRTNCDDSETELLYPEIETDHAVVNRIKETTKVG
jgi:hypothetical protein